MIYERNSLRKCLVGALLCFCSMLIVCFGDDRITSNNTLSGSKTIVSAEGKFALGFFNPENSSNYYLGIWYSNIPIHTVVWVANREAPLSDKDSSFLKIDTGNLALFNESSHLVWSTNVSNPNLDSVEAVLGDKGNLVLKSGNETLWQSFDHPAEKWLPGGRIGRNKISNRSTFLTSWKRNSDPAPGLFTMQLDPSGIHQYISLWNFSEQYWSSGPWNEQTKIFQNVPEMRTTYIYNFMFVDNENESYFTYDVYDNASISYFTMTVSGQVEMISWLYNSNQWTLFWSKPAQCDVYAFCGPFSRCNDNSPFCQCLQGFRPNAPSEWDAAVYSGGCTNRVSLQCKSDGFRKEENITFPDNNHTITSSTMNDCQSACLNNCSCTAFAYEDNHCLVWYGDLLNLQDDSGGKTLHVRLAASEFSSKNKKGIIIGCVIAAAGVVTILVFLRVILRREKSPRGRQAVDGSLASFGYREVQIATKNFSEKLGGGGFGSVYKGVLPDKTIVAVKKLQSITQGEKQFRTEVSTIGTIQHVNLVRLRGFCAEDAEKLLLYEYMPNGSLDIHLFKENSLPWNIRYNTALGVARGLHYLHERCRDCIIHCDIKPENILLDADFAPKVSDFGLAKLVGRDFSRVLTTMRGTRGYLAPEWISGVPITVKADVYSYGMMLFEIVSGRRNSDAIKDEKTNFFPSLAAVVVSDGGDCMSLLDPRLGGDADEGEVSRLCKCACWCVQDDESQRPSMGQVIQILEGVADVDVPRVPRTLQVFFEDTQEGVYFTESSASHGSFT